MVPTSISFHWTDEWWKYWKGQSQDSTHLWLDVSSCWPETIEMELPWKLILLLSLVDCLTGNPPKHTLFHVVSTGALNCYFQFLFFVKVPQHTEQMALKSQMEKELVWWHGTPRAFHQIHKWITSLCCVFIGSSRQQINILSGAHCIFFSDSDSCRKIKARFLSLRDRPYLAVECAVIHF